MNRKYWLVLGVLVVLASYGLSQTETGNRITSLLTNAISAVVKPFSAKEVRNVSAPSKNDMHFLQGGDDGESTQMSYTIKKRKTPGIGNDEETKYIEPVMELPPIIPVTPGRSRVKWAEDPEEYSEDLDGDENYDDIWAELIGQLPNLDELTLADFYYEEYGEPPQEWQELPTPDPEDVKNFLPEEDESEIDKMIYDLLIQEMAKEEKLPFPLEIETP